MRIMWVFFLALIFGFFLFGYMHEQVHIQIYKGYGIDAHAEYFSHFPDFVTIAEEPCPTEECALAHNINEAVGYHLMVFYFITGIFMFIVVMFLEGSMRLKLKVLEDDRHEGAGGSNVQ